MTFGQTEAILLTAFVMLWWFFYFVVKMRADQKEMKRQAKGAGEDETSPKPADRPCQGCMIMQSAMAAAAVLAIFYSIIAMDLVSFTRG